jgi:hypothetical protein
MAGGKRFKFAGSLIKFVLNYAKNSPSVSITAMSKANPCLVTAASHGLATGEIVRINGVVGMTEANGGYYIVVFVSGTQFTLADTDSTNWTTYVSGGKLDEANFSQFCELTNYNRAGGSSPEIDAESLCSTAKEFEIGLPDYGTTSVDFSFAPKTPMQVALTAAYKAGTVVGSRITLPNSGGDMAQLGFVQSMSEQAGKGGLWTGSLVMRNTGPRFDY